MVCYVCLEECEQHSPCKCQAEIHQSCLIQMQIEMPHKNCTICHMPLDIQFKEPSTPKKGCFDIIYFFLWSFHLCSVYILAGWFGKFVAWFLGWITTYSFGFWSLEHFVSFVLVIGAIRVLTPGRPVDGDE